MKTKKKFLSQIGLTVLVFCAIFAVASVIKAATVNGWGWGGSDDGAGNKSGVGWISMHGTGYGVNIPTSDGNLSGYAWSENIGWISFNVSDLVGCPNGTCAAQRSGNNIVGWARIMAMPQAGANAAGWQGWIHLSGTGYGVRVNGNGTISKGATTSYAWSDELGFIDFSQAALSASPTATLDVSPITIDVDAHPDWSTKDGGYPVTLKWNITGATTCTKSSSNGVWTGTAGSTGQEIVRQKDPSVTYKLVCSGVIDQPQPVTVVTGCHANSCSNTICGLSATFSKTIVSSSADCVSSNKCSTDSDCQPRTGSGWQEVAP